MLAAALLLAQGLASPLLAQAASISDSTAPKEDRKPELSPEEKMSRRFPQPVRVGALIGLPVLDDNDSTIGYIRDVVRTPAGKIELVVPYGRWFGWVKLGGPFDWGRRLVGVPIETVAILARQVDAIDMPLEMFDKAPIFAAGQNTSIGREETVKIALGHR